MVELDKLAEKLGDKRIKLGPPRLTIYEIGRILGARTAQIAQGAPTLIDIDNEEEVDVFEIAKKELKKKLLPVTVHRVSPSGEEQIIPIKWLKYEEDI